jgi:anthranilate phosphoribosyltransferase
MSSVMAQIAPGGRAADISDCLKELARGHAGCRSLEFDRARDLFEKVFRGDIDDLALGALVIALRMKGESIDEVQAALSVLQDGFINTVPVDPTRPVVSIPSYNGARHMANLTPLLAWLLADSGVQVLVHGVVRDPRRTTTWEVLHAMGIGAARHAEDAANTLARGSPAFVPVHCLSKPLADLLDLRARLGVRNLGHTLAKLINPSNVAHCLRLTAFTHPEFYALQKALLQRTDACALVMRGTEGEAVANVKRRAGIEWVHEGRCETMVEADSLPLGEVPSLPPAHDAAATGRWIQSVLAGERPVPPAISTQVECVLRALRTPAPSALRLATCT